MGESLGVRYVDVSKTYQQGNQDISVLRGVTFDVAPGEFIALMGPSGCGKTTTLRMIAGLEAPSEGEIRLSGRRMNEVAPWERDTPLVWQSLALFPFMSVLKNVEFGLKMRNIAPAERTKRSTSSVMGAGAGMVSPVKIGSRKAR